MRKYDCKFRLRIHYENTTVSFRQAFTEAGGTSETDRKTIWLELALVRLAVKNFLDLWIANEGSIFSTRFECSLPDSVTQRIKSFTEEDENFIRALDMFLHQDFDYIERDVSRLVDKIYAMDTQLNTRYAQQTTQQVKAQYDRRFLWRCRSSIRPQVSMALS